MYYLTEEDYAIAEANGIPRNYVYHRYYDSKWEKDRAITEPVGTYKRVTTNMKHWEEWKEVAESNGVTKQMFYNRLNKEEMKWTPEEAASTPKGARRKNQRISPDIYELARKNGIKVTTLRNRIFNLNWNPVRAATDNGRTIVEGVLV